MTQFKSIKELKSKTERQSGEKQDPERYIKLSSGDSVTLRFRQELAEDGTYADDEIGFANVIGVHSNPGNWRKKARCTADSEKDNYECWACEQARSGEEEAWRWKAKPHLVVNVAIQKKNEAGETVWVPKVFEQRLSPQHTGEQAIEFAEEWGTLLNREYRFTRKGDGTKTNYNLMPLDQIDPNDEDGQKIKELPLHDLDQHFFYKSYSDQPAYYLESGDGGSSGGW